MRRVILDTDVASLSIKQRLPPALLRELLGAQIGITFITLGERNYSEVLWRACQGAA